MMTMPELTERWRADMTLEHAKRRAYDDICPPMNRAERRTAKGRLLVALAEAAVLRVENEWLRDELGRFDA